MTAQLPSDLSPTALLDIVIEVLTAHAQTTKPVEIGPETLLGRAGLDLDSIAILQVLLELEQRTGTVLRDESLTADALISASALARYLHACSKDTDV